MIGSHPVVTRAVDDTGRRLTTLQSPIAWSTPPEGSDQQDFWLTLTNPSRRAMRIRELSGYLELVYPDHHRASDVVIRDPLQHTGHPLSSPSLAAAGVTVTLWTGRQFEARQESATSGGNGGPVTTTTGGGTTGGVTTTGGVAAGRAGIKNIVFDVRDPRFRMVGAVLEDATGSEIRLGHFIGLSKDTQTLTYFYGSEAPPAAARIVLATPQSVTRAPFKLVNLKLP